jgi:hypothetical protein
LWFACTTGRTGKILYQIISTSKCFEIKNKHKQKPKLREVSYFENEIKDISLNSSIFRPFQIKKITECVKNLIREK